MDAGPEQRPGRGNEIAVDVLRGDRHVGAVGPIEDVRKGLPVANAQDHQRGQALGVGGHVPGVAPPASSVARM